MDCRIIDCKVVVRDDSLVSVAPNNFGQADKSDCYFGRVVRVAHDESGRIKWFEDDTISIEPLDKCTTTGSRNPWKEETQIPDVH